MENGDADEGAVGVDRDDELSVDVPLVVTDVVVLALLVPMGVVETELVAMFVVMGEAVE